MTTADLPTRPLRRILGAQRGKVRGLTLVELMIALLLGLIVTAIVTHMLLSNLQSFKVNEGLARVQESSRSAFEIMARDVREAGQTSCGSALFANVIRSGGAVPAWADMTAGSLHGYDGAQAADLVAIGSAVGQRVDGTDAILIYQAGLTEAKVQAHDPAALTFTLASVTGLAAGDPAIVCDGETAAVLQIGNPDAGAKTVSYAPAHAPLNCSTALGYPGSPVPVGCSAFSNKTFTPGGFLAQLSTSLWYIGHNASGGKSLFKARIEVAGGAVSTDSDEMIHDVHDLQIKYLTADISGATPTLATDWVSADSVTDWSPTATAAKVIAVRLVLDLRTSDKVGSGGDYITRKLATVVALRNREIH